VECQAAVTEVCLRDIKPHAWATLSHTYSFFFFFYSFSRESKIMRMLKRQQIVLRASLTRITLGFWVVNILAIVKHCAPLALARALSAFILGLI